MKQLVHRIILFAMSGTLLVGCKAPSPSQEATSSRKTAVKPAVLPVSAQASPDENSEEEMEDSDSSTNVISTGTPESLAHYAAGISYALSDKTEQALEQFYKSALSDPTNEPLVLAISRDLLSKNQPQKAAELLKKSAQRPDASASVLVWLAQANFQGGKTNEAITISQSAIKKAPDALDGYESLFDIYLKSAKTNDARAVLDKAAHKLKNIPDLITLGEMHAGYLKEFSFEPSVRDQGIKILDRAAATKPYPDALLFPLAQAYERLSELVKSADIYQKILASNPKSPAQRDALREKLAKIYIQAQQPKKAAEQLESLVRDNPTRHPEAWVMLGELAVDNKQYADAVTHFQKAILLKPSMEQVYYEMALAQIDSQKGDEALQTLEQARKKFPRSFPGEFFTGLAYSHLKNFSEAIKHFTAAEVIGEATDPKRLNQQFYFQLGAASERNKQYKEAVDYFEKSLKIAPDYHESMNYLGYMWAERGENLDKARELIEKAVKSEPKNAAYLDSMGWVLFKLNKPDEALPWLLKSIQLTEEPDATLYDHTGDVYRALKQLDKARQSWKKSLEIEPNEEVKKKLDQLPVSDR